MSARDDILSAIRAAGVPSSPKPAPVIDARSPDDLLATFIATLAQAGGRGIVRDATQSTDAVIADISTTLGANSGDVQVISGRFAVAENGAVYVDAADLNARADIVQAEHLVLLVQSDAIVHNMHEAMSRIPAGSTCGWFLSGPSKTADIEQALVVGAQGARTLHVIVEPA